MTYEYYINLDERGEFNADVRNEDGQTLFEIADMEVMQGIVEDGFMRHTKDVGGLTEWLQEMGAIPEDAQIVLAN